MDNMDRVLVLFFSVILFTILISSCNAKEVERIKLEEYKMEHKVKMKRMQDELDGKYDLIPIQVVHCIEADYEIDLKQDYIIVYSKSGNVDTIPHGKLEAFFERDNM